MSEPTQCLSDHSEDLATRAAMQAAFDEDGDDADFADLVAHGFAPRLEEPASPLWLACGLYEPPIPVAPGYPAQRLIGGAR